MLFGKQGLLKKIHLLVKKEKVKVFLKRLEKLDLKPLAHQLMGAYGWTCKRSLLAILRYLMFLCLICLYPDRLLVPTPEIDAVWHCHILQTRKYRQDCQVLFGQYLDHEPNLEVKRMTNQPSVALTVAYTQTKALFEQHFGVDAFDSAQFDQFAGLELAQAKKSESGDENRIACGRPA